jgi:hypothetical protein
MVGRSAVSRGPSERDQEVGREGVAVLLAQIAQAGRAHLLAHLDQVAHVEAQLAA